MMQEAVKFVRLSSSDRSEWDALASSSTVSTWFQTPEAYDFYSSLPEIFEPFAFGVEEDGALEGAIVGYVTREANPLKQFLTRRAIVIGGPLLSDDVLDDALRILLKETVRELRRKAIYIETRNLNDYSRWKHVFEEASWEYEPHLNFHIDTTSESVVMDNLGRGRKREVRLSIANSVEIETNPSMEDIRVFYSILSKLYRDKIKTPLYPFTFFETLYQKTYAQYVIIKHEGSVIGGALNVRSDCGVVYGWFLCGENGAIKHIYPATMADFASMQSAARSGYFRYDLMGAGKPDEDYGVRKFKAEFGGTLVEHGRFKYICSPLLYKIGCVGVKILRKL